MIYTSPYPDLDYPSTDVVSLILGDLSPDDAALPAITELSTGVTATYGELKDRVESIAGALAERGVGPGDVVTLQVPNSINFAAALLGIMRTGATVNPVGMLMNQADVEHIVHASGSVLFIGPTDLEQIPQIFSMELGALARRGLSAPALRVDPDSLAALPFSSGTTGLPKGVMLTHRNLVSNIVQVDAMMGRTGISERANTLSALPFSHIYGLTALLLAPLYRRQHVFTMPKFDLDMFLAAHADKEIELTFIAPPMAIALAKGPQINPSWFSASRLIISAAAPLDAPIMRAVEDRLNTKVVQGWGMTEASPMVTMNIHGDAGHATVGKAVPDTELRLVNIDTLDDVAEGEEGEVLVRGPQVMQGYFNNEKATAETLLSGGWLRTGDIARIEEDGGLRIIDRAKEVIKYKGYQVAPAELEALLLTHPDIADAGVVGADRNGLEIPRAFVVLRHGAELTAGDIMDWVADRVTPYKKVRAVEFVSEIPKNPTGKILRRELREVPWSDEAS
ncbi:AMP-binding protein [Corynebacterium sp.]|uniref:AMP-binding protein n=1 Tax=Corynebacterium sp. TaxID=1720 RepID=UPI002A91C0FE|nr:AMP-binding protein [Corynebacterium sp.]MDY5784877.1 AMP-binding protein [Corynebacterium sp.]